MDGNGDDNMDKTSEESRLRKCWKRLRDDPRATSSWINNSIFNPERQNPIWYDGVVLRVVFMGRFSFSISTEGRFMVINMNNGNYCDSLREAVDWLEESGIHNDEEFISAEKHGDISVDNVPWFEFSIYDQREEQYLLIEYTDVPCSPVEFEPCEVIKEIFKYIREQSEQERICSVQKRQTFDRRW